MTEAESTSPGIGSGTADTLQPKPYEGNIGVGGAIVVCIYYVI
jgi:hypothetical protein